MNDFARRCLLYGIGTTTLAALAYAGFVYRADADVGTLLGAANMQLRIAYGLPAADKDGRPLAARLELLAAAADNLRRAKAQAPDEAVVVEFEGFLASLQDDPKGAAACYRRARSLPTCTRDQRDVLLFNEARMLDAAGDRDGALRLLQREGASVQPRYRQQARVEEASLLGRLGRHDAAVALLDTIVHGAEDPMTWLQAGQQYAELGRAEAAEAALVRASQELPIADYYRARLKLRSGAVDSCCELLERAVAAAPTEVRRMLREDADDWTGLAANERFQRLAAPSQAAPGR